LLRSGLIPGLIRFVVQLFKQFLHTMEAVLFKVDEWLRFRGGDSRLAMIVRIVLGLVWFPVSYLARFNMVVLIEPCLNPVKLPVCAIATKVMVPLYATLGLKVWVANLPVVSGAIMVWVLFWLPDVFGFLFWEMKENWSLYRANRGPEPQPAVLGQHGETMRRLLQPGFHSGTIPKLFAKLRHAEQTALETGNFTPVRAWRAALEEVEDAVRLFVTREFLVLLEQEEAWKKQPLRVGRIRLATNQVRVELLHDGFPEQPVWLEFEDNGTSLTAGLMPAPWLRGLAVPEQRALRSSLTVLFQLAGADEVRDVEWAENRNGVFVVRGLETVLKAEPAEGYLAPVSKTGTGP
jgi:hypothetical protein